MYYTMTADKRYFQEICFGFSDIINFSTATDYDFKPFCLNSACSLVLKVAIMMTIFS